jgi:hypothetical protein
MEIQAGTLLDCVTADGGHIIMQALGPVLQGLDFPVVWVATPEEYQRALDTGDEADGIPWPYSAVQLLEHGKSPSQ